MDDIMEELNKKAQRLGATSFGLSKKPYKRFYVIYDGRIIHFGSKYGSTYIDNKDINKKMNWRARHSRILKNGYPAYLQIDSPEYWNWNLTW